MRLEGTLAYRDGEVLVELVAGSIAQLGEEALPPDATEALGRHARGEASYFLLAAEDGGPVGARVVERGLVAEPVRVEGEVLRLGVRLVLRPDPDSYERLDVSGGG